MVCEEVTVLTVCVQDDTWDIFLDGIVARNRALNGDVVVVQVLPQEQWKVKQSCSSLLTVFTSSFLPGLSSGTVNHTSND